jgi:hypothetical protein
VWHLVDDVGPYTVNYYKCVTTFRRKTLPNIAGKGDLSAQILLQVTFTAAPTSAKLNNNEEAGGTFFRNVEKNLSYTLY